MKTCRVLLLCMALGMSACDEDSNVSSVRVPTSEVYAEMHVTADGSGWSTADVQLQRDSATSNVYLNLDEGDQLWMSTGGTIDEVEAGGDLFDSIGDLVRTHRRLREGVEILFNFLNLVVFTGEVWYDGKLPADVGATFRIAFRRNNNGTDAPDSTVAMPAAFSLSAPLAGESYARSSDDITVNWEPSGTTDTMLLNVTSSCLDGSGDTLDQTLSGDSGSHTITAGTLSGLDGECSTRIEITRSRLGSVDPAYGAGGRIAAHQVRGVVVTTTE